ncbi:nitrite reductase/ring-hydroxylating ferredoxin subunit/uncharacterized membrane protein [Spinactinospora alkalitolerans]|uniref:Nitrite reductase/ring-hydroxylating ferredoxin subunit/uncharacterized membrane protein n=1 Tax=Spinactinospora alkalitolerans TaxID=687207 RepID=A0A852U2E8_9ACTN|nr:Rieske (2Fe-2S) protein [Spinactinospora alkalitolerans]NYE50398.1 nitrite reductase/ring-hydroxylating ferredoxin subunit/uncharacterized membrane protein [Spinactinospora alkalitolerans]
MRLGERIHRIERAKGLDRVAGAMKRVVDAVPEGRFRDVLHGVQLGHPMHPLMVQVPIGAWLSAAVLDCFPGTERSARRLVNTGIIAAVPAMAAGAADWSRQHERHQRVGVVHAAANNVALMLYGASSMARSRGRHGWGKALGAAGLGAVGVGGMLGAHIAYHLAGGANRADYVTDRMPSEWHDIGMLTEFPEETPMHGVLGDTPLVIVRSGGEVHVMAEICSHMSGPLSKGEVSDDCITCPWHGSTFRLADGGVVSGPATASQPVLETRVRDGVVSVRRPESGALVPPPRSEAAGAGSEQEKQPTTGRARG